MVFASYGRSVERVGEVLEDWMIGVLRRRALIVCRNVPRLNPEPRTLNPWLSAKGRVGTVLGVLVGMVLSWAYGDEALVARAREGMRKAGAYWATEVAYKGGYVWDSAIFHLLLSVAETKAKGVFTRAISYKVNCANQD